MSTLWVPLALLAPLAGVALGRALRGRDLPPAMVIALNALMPGTGLAAAGCALLEVAAAAVMAQLSLLVIGGPADLDMWFPIAAVGGGWALLHTPHNPLTRSQRQEPDAVSRPSSPSAAAGAGTPTSRPAPGPGSSTAETAVEPEQEADLGYAVTVACSECGADIEVAVLRRMAVCEFCGSSHLVVGQDEVLQLALPERIRRRRSCFFDTYTTTVR